MKPMIRVLAVGDPAVKAYVNGKNSIISRWESQNDLKVDFQILPWQDYYPKLITFNNEKGIRSLEKYVQLKNFAPQDTANHGNEEIKTCIQEGKCAFAVSWGGQAGEIMREIPNKERIGYATFEHPWNVTWSFAVPKRSSQKELAMGLLFYLSSKTIDQETGCYAGSPVRSSSYDSQ